MRYLVEEEDRLKLNLQESEAAVGEYKANNPGALQLGGGTAGTGSQPGSGAGAGGSRGGIVEDKLQDLNSKLTAVKTDRLRLEGELNQIEGAGNDLNSLLEVPGISLAALVNEARHNVTQIEAEIATLSLRYKAKHPKMVAARKLDCFIYDWSGGTAVRPDTQMARLEKLEQLGFPVNDHHQLCQLYYQLPGTNGQNAE